MGKEPTRMARPSKSSPESVPVAEVSRRASREKFEADECSWNPRRSAPEETGQDLAAPRQLHEQFARWERDVQEEPDVDVGAELAQHLGDQLELIVVDPHGAAGRDVLGDGRREAHVDFAVGVPPGAVERRRADRVVIERPDRGVGEAEVELLVLLGADRDRLQPDALVGRRWLLVVRGAGPADPQSLAILQHRREGRDQSAGTREPPVVARRAGVTQRQSIGDDDEVGRFVRRVVEGVVGDVRLGRSDLA